MKTKYKILSSAFLTLAPMLGLTASPRAWADECTKFDYGGTCYETLAEAFTALNASNTDGTIVLMSDLEDASNSNSMWSGAANTKTALDLNGHNLTLTSSSARIIVWGNEFSITGEGTMSLARDLPFAIIGSDNENDAGTAYTVLNVGKDVTLNSTYPNNDDWYMIPFASNYSNKYGIVVNFDGKITNSSNVSGAGFYVNGNFKGADITLNIGSTAEINAKEGAYIAGSAKVNFAGTINAEVYGIEIRAGELNVTGGTITVDGDTAYSVNPNGNGSTTKGAAVAAVQHTTLLPLSVNISGGSLTAQVAFSEANPQQNPRDAIDRIQVAITGGEFTATNGEPIVASEDVTEFITGGTYSKIPETQYIADDYTAYETSEGGDWVVAAKPSATVPDALYVQVGGTVDLDVTASPEYYSMGIVDGKATYGSENNTITGVEAGNTMVMIEWHDIDATNVTFPVYVYDITSEENEDLENENDVLTVQGSTVTQVSDFLANGSEEGMYVTENGEFWNLTGLKAAIADGLAIHSTLSMHTIDMGDTAWVESTLADFADGLDESDNVAMVYFIDVPVYFGELDDDNVFGRLTKLNEKITLRLGIPAGLPEVEEGFKREFFAIRRHMGPSDDQPTFTRLDVTLDGDTAIVEDDSFSDFVLAYTDVEDLADEPEDPTDEPEDPTDEPEEPTDEPEEPTGEPEKDDGVDTPNTGVATGESGSVTSGVVAFVLTFVTLLVAGGVYKNISRKNQRKNAQAKLTK